MPQRPDPFRSEADRAALRADRAAAVGRLVDGVAHDFNNLLTAVLGYAQLLEADPDLDGEPRHNAREILAAARRASDVIRPLLAVSRRPTGAPASLDVNGCLRELEPLFESALGRRITLRYELAEDLPPARADRATLEQALLHLVIRARDAPGSGGAVTIATAALRAAPGDEGPPVDGGDHVALEVRDDGPAPDAETLRRVPEPGESAAPDGGATGSDLATAAALATRIGGSLEIESPPGGGTTARIRLPLDPGGPGREVPDASPA